MCVCVRKAHVHKHTHCRVHTSQGTHLVACLGICSCWYYSEPQPPGWRPYTVHSHSPASEKEEERRRERRKGGKLMRYTCFKVLIHMDVRHLELFLETSSVRISCYLPHHLINDVSDVSSHNLCLPTHHQLTQRVMNE